MAAGFPKTIMFNKGFTHYLFSVISIAAVISVASAHAEYFNGIILSNYPNPFDSRKTTTNILVTKSNQTAVAVTVKIYDLFGNLVKQMESSDGSIVWDGRDNNGRYVAKGGYICVVSTDDGRMIALRKIGVIH